MPIEGKIGDRKLLQEMEMEEREKDEAVAARAKAKRVTCTRSASGTAQKAKDCFTQFFTKF